MIGGVYSISLTTPNKNHLDGDNISPRKEEVFIGGPENALVHTAFQIVQDVLAPGEGPSKLQPGEKTGEKRVQKLDQQPFNPIVLQGPSGTGKSLLARGLAKQRSNAQPDQKVLFLTGADYVRGYAAAVQTDTVDQFRGKHRQATMLVLEDLDDLANKPAAQQELSSQLDEYTNRDALVLATLRCAPGEATWMIPRLTSRLVAGLTIPLAPPEAPTRLAILQHAAAERGLDLPPESAQRLAEELQATAGELYSVLTRLEHADTTVTLQTIRTIQLPQVEEFLQRQTAMRQPSLRDITTLVARRFQLKTSDLKGQARRQAVVRARGLAMYLARELTGQSLKQVGSHYGGRDHTTVLHACRKTAQLIETDPQTEEIYTELRGRLAPAVSLG